MSYFNTAKDWFVLGYLLKDCPEKTKFYIEKEVEEHSKEVTTNENKTKLLITGMKSAEAKLILQKDLFTDNGDDVLSVRNELLKIDPRFPNVDNLTALVNGLFNVFKRFKLHVSTNEHDDWNIELGELFNNPPSREDSTDRLFKKVEDPLA